MLPMDAELLADTAGVLMAMIGLKIGSYRGGDGALRGGPAAWPGSGRSGCGGLAGSPGL